MREKLKKTEYSLLYRSIAAGICFLLLVLLKRSESEMFKKICALWQKSADLKAAAKYFARFVSVMLPF